MSMYLCTKCGQYIDDDYFPCGEDEVCPSCEEKPVIYIFGKPVIEIDDSGNVFKRGE